jgi:hypothetical protein
MSEPSTSTQTGTNKKNIRRDTEKKNLQLNLQRKRALQGIFQNKPSEA